MGTHRPLAERAEELGLEPKQLGKLLDRFRVTSGEKFRLADHDPADTAGHLVPHDKADALMRAGIERLAQLQEALYAQNRWAVLCLFQAMDAAGKDGTIKHVLTGINPQGVQVTSFKQPGPEALAHDFLWRSVRDLPERGRIGIHNRSHYEEVLVVRVHPELLARQRLPDAVTGKHFWKHRRRAIAAFEAYLAQQGTAILKFFLHLSKQEQRRRFLARLEEADKHWKFSAADLSEREHWDEYQAAYEKAIRATAAPHAPWYLVPADHKWFAHLVVLMALVDQLEQLDLHVPELSQAQQQALAEARVQLEKEA